MSTQSENVHPPINLPDPIQSDNVLELNEKIPITPSRSLDEFTMLTVVKNGTITSSKIPEKKSPLVQMASKGSSDDVAKYVLENEEIRPLIIQRLMETLNKQCEELCSITNKYQSGDWHLSKLRQKDVTDLVCFNWNEFLYEEIKERAWLLYKVAVTVACPKKANQRQTKEKYAQLLWLWQYC
jgi:hypothetical protein